MASIIEIHHILPEAAFRRFESQIALWTGGTFQLDADYNLIPLATGVDGVGVNLSPVHDVAHWLNEAWQGVLLTLSGRTDLTNAESGQQFEAIFDSFKTGMGIYNPDLPIFQRTILSRDDPISIELFGHRPIESEMYEYCRGNFNYENITNVNQAYQSAILRSDNNGIFVANRVFDRRPLFRGGPDVLDGQTVRDYFGVEANDNGTFSWDRSKAGFGAPVAPENLDALVSQAAREAFEEKGLRGTLVDALSRFGSDEEGSLNAAEVEKTADRFMGLLERMASDPSFEGRFKAGVVGELGGTIANVAQFAYAAYDSFMTGLSTGNWTSFAEISSEFGVSALISTLAIAAFTALLPEAAVPIFTAFIIGFAAEQTINAISDLVGKIERDPRIPSPLRRFLRDPLILDLAGDGVTLSSLSGSSVYFDYSGNGLAERTGWVSGDDGILAFDANNNGVVDGAAELRCKKKRLSQEQWPRSEAGCRSNESRARESQTEICCS